MISHAYVKLPAQNVERARQFYAEKLGLEPYAESESHLFYEVAGTSLLVFPSAGAPSGSHDQWGLLVDDLEAEVERLKDAGVSFETYEIPGAPMPDGILDRGYMKVAWFKDSEGNLISIATFLGDSPFASQVRGASGDGRTSE